MTTSLIWFRNDLRLEDNETLIAAIDCADCTLPVYIIDPRVYQETGLGFAKTGVLRSNFIAQSLANLRENLRKIGGDLLIVEGLPEQIIPSLAQQYHVSKIYYQQEATPEEQQVENTLEAELKKRGISTEKFWTSTMIHRADLPFGINQMPIVFTQFRNKVERSATFRSPLRSPKNLTLPPNFNPAESLDTSSRIQAIKKDNRSVLHFEGGETNALVRLKKYIWESDSLRNYKETRNGLIGENFSSKFSPWLANGCISARTIAYEIEKYEARVCKNESTHWLKFELLWRDFFRFTALQQGGKLFRSSGFNGMQKPPMKRDTTILQKWIDGKTGDDFVDANMKELAATGWMSNRGRQNVASYLTHDMKIDWLMGAAYFESQLLDYDPCSNYGNWAYIAGVGNDPRPVRKFNTVKQAHDYDPQGTYRNLWKTNA